MSVSLRNINYCGYLFSIIYPIVCIVAIAQAEVDKMEEYMTIKELNSFCRPSGYGGGRLCCEEKEVKVKGYLDPINIFDKSHYPMLPYQKFRIVDAPRGDFLEIYPVEGDTSLLFKKLHRAAGLPQKLLYIRGVVKGFDAHTNVGSYRLFYLTIHANNVFFYKDTGSPSKR